ncbi:MAG: succinate dehydrogenase, hydrophobic membrane anchor protein [Yoonia sp.]|uniref:succinate dehydrogenase, hydrophobic membrane anchor protein n=1 Tax=Rhodobacterales TaxID=204455 RepID=UPI001FF2D069|nr:succinate dehydrogenase, hydrophobic membrane anchor protein [Loktanella sp. F6476L]MCK0120225.1 succinate dehydrogenase, hydrophobic membrane anchor protein [Loktanella sp. F6476L]UWQ99014.1 succinate dehydrogenase, hydrophobic membrane anchor protein [Rhodobacteraceae bacterium S2214]
MAFVTDRKRVVGMGSAKTGTDHHWKMMVSSVALVVLIPLFIFTFGATLGSSYEEVVAYYARPVPAAIAALTFVVSFFHFRKGVQTLIEDYVHGIARKALIIAMICLSYGAAALGVIAILRLAL